MAENFIVSARKYRPDTWETVVGQKHITTTLQSAIANNQVAQAYLFTGPRGVGKTTCARIFARAVNGLNDLSMEEMQFNVFELDAASNNSVEDIRSIVDSVRIPPQIGRFKVYIIDEVHMLSTAAFNAFLKTLEEPPAHAIFILATTEKHKIIPTILSRCQIFDFNRIKVKDMTDHLSSIAAKEGITAETEALHVIAQKADGAMRDALSIFDQVVAFCGKNLTYQAVIQNLNVLDYDYYFKLTDLILKEDVAGCLVLFDQVLNKGFDGHHFITGLGGHFRNLLVSKDPQTISLMEVTDSVADKYKTQAEAADLRLLIQGLQMINECDNQYRSSKHQRLLVELTLMKLASIPYNNREGEKKNFRLKPFRSGAPRPSVSAREANPIPADKKPSSPPPPVSTRTLPGEAKPVVKPTLGKSSIILKSSESVSIKSAIRQHQAPTNNAEAETKEAVRESVTRVYSTAEITEAWHAFADAELQHNKQVQGAFKVAVLELRDGHILKIGFPSSTQEMYFNDYRSQLTDFLRLRSDIRGLDFEVSILRQDEIKSTYMTAKQRYDALVQKNPSLENLRKKFGLQIDF